jgi:hypothetical protein
MLKNVKKMLDNVGHMWGFITVIAVGLVDSYSFLAWIQAILWFRFGSFMVQCIVTVIAVARLERGKLRLEVWRVSRRKIRLDNLKKIFSARYTIVVDARPFFRRHCFEVIA